ncbi:MAG: hypothetical protein Kow0081_4930 [Candidatus Dojkabacteria bacterium]
MFTLDTAVTVFTVVINFLIIFAILTGNYKRKVNVFFAFFLLFFALWKITLSFYINQASGEFLLFWGRANFAAAVGLGYFVLKFANNFPDENAPYIKNKNLILFYDLISVLLFALTLFSGFTAENELIVNGEKETIFGPGYILFFIHLIFSIGFTIFILTRKYKKESTKFKKQLRLIILSFAIGGAFALTTNLFLPYLFNIFEFQELGHFGTVIISIFVFFGIIRYQFLDIRFFLGKAIYYLFLSLIAYLTFNVIAAFYLTLFGSVFATEAMLVGIAISFLFVIVFNSIANYIQLNISARIITPGYSPQAEITRLSNSLNTDITIESICKKTFTVINSTLKPSYAGIAFLDQENNITLNISTQIGISITEASSKQLIKYMKDLNIRYARQDDIFMEQTKNKKVSRLLMGLMKQNEIDLVISFQNEDGETFGIIIMGEKETKSTYTNSEVNFISSISDILGVTISRALLYSQVKKFNETLQQKIAEATEELQIKNKQLAEALRKEQDMMDIIGHELRTPIGTARNALMFLDQLVQKNKLTKDKYEKYMGIAIENIKREKALLQTILQSARIENDKLQTKKELISIHDVIEDSLTAFKEEGEEKGLKIIVDSNINKKELVVGDRNALQQVVDNLLSNAIKYTQIGSVTIKLEDLAKKVKVSIIDTGEGISKKDLKNIGKKFFRANPYLNSKGQIDGKNIVRPGGTGIGIYVVKGLLKSMKSALHIKSKLGEGSVFYFSIKKATEKDKQTLPMATKNASDRIGVA